MVNNPDKKPPMREASEPPVENAEEQIRRRAYELYEARGRQEGNDLDDWLQAEAEVQAETVVAQRKATAA